MAGAGAGAGGDKPSGPAGAVSDRGERLVTMGRVSGLYGVRGWVRVYSFTQPPANILDYDAWYVQVAGEWQWAEVQDARRHGKGLVAKLSLADDRDQARRLLEAPIAVARGALPAPAPGEYYWADLLGLEVYTPEGVYLGRVIDLMETGANDVLVVEGERERLVPFVQGEVVTQVDLGAGRLEVDWDPEF